MKTGLSPTQRTLRELRSRGALVGITEHWNSFAKIRQDLFGFCDLVVIFPGRAGITAIQCTSGANHAARKKKILQNTIAPGFLKAGNTIEVWSWRKLKKEGWKPKIENIVLADFEV